MSRELQSIRKQIAETEDNLRRIDERISEYVEPTAVPLQLLKDRDQLKAHLDDLRERERRLSVEPEAGNGGRLPSLLTYDLNRSDQEFELSQKIETLGLSAPKPIICLIHGEDKECPDKFIDCLEKIGLRRLLNLKPNLSPYRIYIPKWPSQLHEIDRFHERYRKSLADHILGYSRASKQEINDWLASHPEPVIIESEFLTRNWQHHAAKIVTKVLEFWQDWPPLAAKQVLLICLSIKYPRQAPPGILGVFGYKPLSEVVADALQALAHGYNNQVILAVLPRLKGVTQQHTEDWVRDNESDLLRRFGEDGVDDLQETIRSMFEQYPSQEDPKRIPMADMTHQLRSVLRRHKTQWEEASR